MDIKPSRAWDERNFAVVGLGNMGRNLVLNLVEHGIVPAIWDANPARAAQLSREDKRLRTSQSANSMTRAMVPPRVLLLLVPHDAVDPAIRSIVDALQVGDVIVDCGNSHFLATERREHDLHKRGVVFAAAGLSGGTRGAREGLCFVLGEAASACEILAPIVAATAARSMTGSTVLPRRTSRRSSTMA